MTAERLSPKEEQSIKDVVWGEAKGSFLAFHQFEEFMKAHIPEQSKGVFCKISRRNETLVVKINDIGQGDYNAIILDAETGSPVEPNNSFVVNFGTGRNFKYQFPVK